jgi:transglutaminase-like putative cysteine protease
LNADWLDDGVLLLVALAAGVGTGRLTSGPSHVEVLVPIGLCVVAGHGATTLVGRIRRIGVLSPVAGLLAVALTAVWTLVPGATRSGIPTPTTWRFVINRFQEAGTIIRAHPTPLPAVSSVVMVLAVASGLAAVLGGVLWELREGRNSLVALVPTFGLVVYTALFSSRVDRAQDSLAYMGAALLFVVIAGRAPGQSARRSGVTSGFAGSALAVGVALACSAGLGGMQLLAFPTSVANGQGTGGGGGAHAGAPDLIDNIQALLSNESKDVMFTARSTLPTYWQVGVLSYFDGTSWLPDPVTQSSADGTYNGYGGGDLPYLPEPNPTTTFTSQVTVADLQATLLPVPPTTVAVNDPNISVFLPDVGLVQPIAAPAGSVYTTEARVPVVSDPSGAAGPSAASETPASTSELDFYRTLPPVPKRVVALAHRIVAGISSPFEQASALARYFDTGRFQYTLYPTVEPGESPLVSFLFSTRAGFCQQFAGAYAVLARLDGLPTRLAIGFTPGTSDNGVYTVKGADSHVWPEVYMGPSAGWVSFEPTPAQAHESLAAGVVVGSRVKAPVRSKSSGHAGHPSGSSTPNPVTVPTVRNVAAAPAAPKGPKPRNISHQAPSGTGRHPAAPFPTARVVGIALAAIVAAAVLDAALGGRVLRRRLEHAARRLGRSLRMLAARLRPRPGQFAPTHTGGPTAEVIARWERAALILEASRLARRQDETLVEHAARVGGGRSAMTLAWPPPEIDASAALRRGAFDAYRLLVDLAGKASYGAEECTDEDAGAAKVLCEAVRAGLE